MVLVLILMWWSRLWFWCGGPGSDSGVVVLVLVLLWWSRLWFWCDGPGSDSGVVVLVLILMWWSWLQPWLQAGGLPHHDPGEQVSPGAPAVHGVVGDQAPPLHPDHGVGVVLPGQPQELGGVRPARELDSFFFDYYSKNRKKE